MRPRSDLYMQHFLSSQQCRVIPIKHLFVEYRHWIKGDRPFDSVEEELQVLVRHAGYFRRLIVPEPDDVMFDLAVFLDKFDMRTSYPFLLLLADSEMDTASLKEICTVIESYILRRAVCGLTGKRYNRIFLDLTRKMKGDGLSVQGLRGFLAEYRGESSVWPRDSDFEVKWISSSLYGQLNSAMLGHILLRLNASYMDRKMEKVALAGKPTVEHLMPQSWIERWPLPSGRRGLTDQELWREEGAASDRSETRDRNALIHTIGNLTILTGELNAGVSNWTWTRKRAEMMRHSLLPINQMLYSYDFWDEDTIGTRARELFVRAREIWPGPSDEGNG